MRMRRIGLWLVEIALSPRMNGVELEHGRISGD